MSTPFYLGSFLSVDLHPTRNGVFTANLPDDQALLVSFFDEYPLRKCYIEGLFGLRDGIVPSGKSDELDALQRALGFSGSGISFATKFSPGTYVHTTNINISYGVTARNCPYSQVLVLNTSGKYVLINESELEARTPPSSASDPINQLIARLGF